MKKKRILEDEAFVSDDMIKEAMSSISDEKLKEIRLSVLKSITQPSSDRWVIKKDNSLDVICECVQALNLMVSLYKDDFSLPFDVTIFEQAIESALGNELDTMRENTNLGVILETFVLFDCPANQIINAYADWKSHRGYSPTKLKYSRTLATQGEKSDSIVWLSVYYPVMKDFIAATEKTKFPSNSVQYPKALQALEEMKVFFNDKEVENIICNDMAMLKPRGLRYLYVMLYDIIKKTYPLIYKNGHFLFD